MIEVELPDGTVIAFPEGTPNEVMIDAIQRFLQTSPPAPVAEQPATLAAAEPSMPVGEDVARGIGSGVLSELSGLVDLPSAFVGGVTGLAGRGLERLGIISPELATAMEAGTRAAIPGGGTTQYVDEATGGALSYEPQTQPGKYSKRGAQFVTGALATGGASRVKEIPRVAAQYGLLPGAAVEATSQLTEGTKYQPLAEVAAALAAPAAVQAVSNTARRVVSPFGGASQARLDLAKVLDDYGVPITAGQRLGSERLRRAEARSSLGPATRERQLEDFTQAAMRTIGVDSKSAGPDVMRDAEDALSKLYSGAVAGVNTVPDAQALHGYSKVLQTFRNRAPSDYVPLVFTNLNKALLRSNQRNTPLDLNQIKEWRSDMSALTKSADPATRDAALEAVDVLDDLLERTLVAAGRPEAVEQLKDARAKFRNFYAIVEAMGGAGEATALGLISPQRLRSAVVRQNKKAYVTGKRGDVAELSRAAEAIMKPLPAVPEGGVRNVAGLPTAAAGGMGAMVGQGLAGPYGAMLGGAAGAMVPSALQEAVAMPSLQRYLANQRVAPGRPVNDPRLLSALSGLLAQ